MTISILALDLATKTGWATNQPPMSGVEDFSVRRGESPGIRFLRLNAWLHETIELVSPQLIVYEQAHHRGGAATAIAHGMISHVLAVCADKNIEHVAYHTATIKKFATGKGNAPKNQVIDAFKAKFGREPIDDNEADAVWLLYLALSEFK